VFRHRGGPTVALESSCQDRDTPACPANASAPMSPEQTAELDDVRQRRLRIGTRPLTPGEAGVIPASALAPPTRLTRASRWLRRGAPPFRAKQDHRLVRRQARPDVKASRDADHRSRGNPIARRLGVGTIAASPIWRSACQGVGVVVHCLVGGSCCGRRLAGRSAGSRRWSCSYSPGWVPQDLCSSHVRRLKLADR